jgi:hypothetical protein
MNVIYSQNSNNVIHFVVFIFKKETYFNFFRVHGSFFHMTRVVATYEDILVFLGCLIKVLTFLPFLTTEF